MTRIACRAISRFRKIPFPGMTVVIKGNGDPNQLIASAREQLKRSIPISQSTISARWTRFAVNRSRLNV